MLGSEFASDCRLLWPLFPLHALTTSCCVCTTNDLHLHLARDNDDMHACHMRPLGAVSAAKVYSGNRCDVIVRHPSFLAAHVAVRMPGPSFTGDRDEAQYAEDRCVPIVCGAKLLWLSLA